MVGYWARILLFYYKSQFKQFLISYYFTKMYFEESHREIEACGLQTNTTISETDGPFQVLSECEQKNSPDFKNDEWSLEQDAKYMVFVEKYVHLLEGKSYGKLWAVYKAMAEFIQSRNFRQCKLYHQRKCKKYPQISSMVQQFKKQNHYSLTLLNEQATALNLYISNKIKSYISSKQVNSTQSEPGTRSPFLEKFNKTSSEYPLELTLPSFQERKQGNRSPKEEEIMCIKMFQQWSSRLNSSIILSSLF